MPCQGKQNQAKSIVASIAEVKEILSSCLQEMTIKFGMPVHGCAWKNLQKEFVNLIVERLPTSCLDEPIHDIYYTADGQRWVRVKGIATFMYKSKMLTSLLKRKGSTLVVSESGILTIRKWDDLMTEKEYEHFLRPSIEYEPGTINFKCRIDGRNCIVPIHTDIKDMQNQIDYLTDTHGDLYGTVYFNTETTPDMVYAIGDNQDLKFKMTIHMHEMGYPYSD